MQTRMSIHPCIIYSLLAYQNVPFCLILNYNAVIYILDELFEILYISRRVFYKNVRTQYPSTDCFFLSNYQHFVTLNIMLKYDEYRLHRCNWFIIIIQFIRYNDQFMQSICPFSLIIYNSYMQ